MKKLAYSSKKWAEENRRRNSTGRLVAGRRLGEISCVCVKQSKSTVFRPGEKVRKAVTWNGFAVF